MSIEYGRQGWQRSLESFRELRSGFLVEMIDAKLHVVVGHVVPNREPVGSLRLKAKEPDGGAAAVGSAKVDGREGGPTSVIQERDGLGWYGAHEDMCECTRICGQRKVRLRKERRGEIMTERRIKKVT